MLIVHKVMHFLIVWIQTRGPHNALNCDVLTHHIASNSCNL